jgi:opacity protein-like surface antigen
MSTTAKFIVAVLAVLAFTVPGIAQAGRGGFFLNMAGYFPVEDFIHSGYGSGFGAVLSFTPNLSVGFEWKYARLRVDRTAEGLLAGQLSMTPLLVSLYYSFLPDRQVSPYAILGAGLFISNFNLQGRATPEEEQIKSQDIRNGLGWCAGIGAAFRTTARVTVFARALYLGRTADAESVYFSGRTPQTFQVNLSSLSLIAGIEYHY